MTTAAVIVAAMPPALISGVVFTAPPMTSISNVALRVPRLVCMEVIERLLPAARHWTGVAMARIVAVVDVAIKAARTVEPGSTSNENPTSEPIRPIVPVGRTIIGSIVVVSVRAYRWRSDLDGKLGRRCCRTNQQRKSESRQNRDIAIFPVGHKFS